VVAFVGSLLLALVAIAGALVWFAKRRAVGAPLTWGEAMVAATFVFAVMFWSYGVVPHQWLTYAGNELRWRPDAIVAQSGQWELIGIPIPPFTISRENLSHIVAVLIYGLFLTLHVVAFMVWQNRAKVKPVELPTSEYGRPLVRQG